MDISCLWNQHFDGTSFWTIFSWRSQLKNMYLRFFPEQEALCRLCRDKSRNSEQSSEAEEETTLFACLFQKLWKRTFRRTQFGGSDSSWSENRIEMEVSERWIDLTEVFASKRQDMARSSRFREFWRCKFYCLARKLTRSCQRLLPRSARPESLQPGKSLSSKLCKSLKKK